MAQIQLQAHTFYTTALQELAKEHSDLNQFSLTAIEKISINVGVGKYETKDKNIIADYLEKLTGSKPRFVESKVSIAGFKLRKGEIVGLVSTLRGSRMQDFLLHLIYIALPRTRDFKGLKKAAFDKSNKVYSLGIENSAIFPIIGFDAAVHFGMQINIVFKNADESNRELLTKLSFPFTKD